MSLEETLHRHTLALEKLAVLTDTNNRVTEEQVALLRRLIRLIGGDAALPTLPMDDVHGRILEAIRKPGDPELTPDELAIAKVLDKAEAGTPVSTGDPVKQPRRRKVFELRENVFMEIAAGAGFNERARKLFWATLNKGGTALEEALATEGVPLRDERGRMTVATVTAIVEHPKFGPRWVSGMGAGMQTLFEALAKANDRK